MSLKRHKALPFNQSPWVKEYIEFEDTEANDCCKCICMRRRLFQINE